MISGASFGTFVGLANLWLWGLVRWDPHGTWSGPGQVHARSGFEEVHQVPGLNTPGSRVHSPRPGFGVAMRGCEGDSKFDLLVTPAAQTEAYSRSPRISSSHIVHSQCLEVDTQDTGPAYIRMRSHYLFTRVP